MALYPVKDHTAITMATALFQHFCRFGIHDYIISDPGSDLMSATVKLLNQWFGIEKLVSLVDRHESNGVEPTNKQILKHLRVLVHDTRLSHLWSSPVVLPLIEHFLNSAIHSETGLSPLEAKFGSTDYNYFKLPRNAPPTVTSTAFLKLLNLHLQTVRTISHTYQQQLVIKRSNNDQPHNTYQPGDFVLFLRSTSHELPSKLSSNFLGPFEVISHTHNDVTCRNLISAAITVFHSTRLKLFVGDATVAYDHALRDANQHVISSITAYRGDPSKRTTMQFEVNFLGNTTLWVPWSPDLFSSIPYEEFCRSRSELFLLIYSAQEALSYYNTILKTPITAVAPLDIVYVDLRSYNQHWYTTLSLPDLDHTTYVLEYHYTKWSHPKKLKIEATVPVLSEHWFGKHALDAYFVKAFGSNKILTPAMTLITADLLLKHPDINPSKK